MKSLTILLVLILFQSTIFASLPDIGYRVADLSDDFEDDSWSFNYSTGSSNGVWRTGNMRGTPEVLERIAPVAGGIAGQQGALRIRSVDNDGDGYPNQDDFTTAFHNTLFGRYLVRSDQPSLVAHIYIPAYATMQNDWTTIGFRIEARSSDLPNEYYYPSIWTYLSGDLLFFSVRRGGGYSSDVTINDPDYVKTNWQGGWIKLGIYFDSEGVGHYFIRFGVDDFEASDKVYDTSMFASSINVKMDWIAYNIFSLGYPADNYLSPDINIDDMSWYIKNPANCEEVRYLGGKIDGDINKDCRVDFKDLSALIDYWVTCPELTYLNCN